MVTSYKVNVSEISKETSKEHLHQFFAFCGTIAGIDYDVDAKEPTGKAVIAFETPAAAKTAIMLNGGALDGSILTVESSAESRHHLEDDHDHSENREFEQSDKPRAGIAAEYIAKGYKLSDTILQRAIEMDTKHGISKRFLDYFHSVDKSIGERALGPQQTVSANLQAKVEQATQQAKAMDQQRGFTKTATDYYTQAISSQWGQKVKNFYTQTSKQVADIHEEALRIRNQEKGASTQPATSTST